MSAPFDDSPVRFSRLRLFNDSAAHYRENYREETTSMSVGTAAHSLILGGRPIVGYVAGKKRQGKEFDAFKADQPDDAVILTAAEYRLACRMRDSVQANRLAMKVLDGVREQTIWWQDPMLGDCRGTPDVVGKGWITELKTSETSKPKKFKWKVIEYSYHAALAWYLDGIRFAASQMDDLAYIVAVEQKPPAVTTVFRLTESDIEQGRKLIRTWTEQLKACRESGEYPGYSQSVVDLDLVDESIGIDFGDE